MAHELLLLRHAKSDWDQSCDDFDRPLNARGQHDAPRIGRWLRDQNLMPDCVLSSPARRAAQTAQAVCGQLGYPTEHILWDKRLYLASRETLLDVLADQSDYPQRLLLVGHNPGLEDLLEYLSQEPPPRQHNGKLLTTATLAHLHLRSDTQRPARHRAHLRQIVRPRTLPEA
ncbi:MAG: histidine phosphatase family protein [Gammaproteobacteria bacterium]|nr:histidine phosphatase family protein [Gammaproteobacteria bacterium]